ncbi:MAG: SoxR reducing system RseC family protein [Gallionellaceae bacterium]|jgi:sigma-E factor negative regulatory protein RseC|nr:SoxR reducing system RseC family protein [Gallionellaceae bacterium]
MIETKAIVIKIEGRDALVEASPDGGCGQCDTAGGCGKLSRMMCSKPRHFRVSNDIDAHAGDEVRITVADGVLLRSALMLYVLPLALVLIGGFLGTALASDTAARDGYAATGALIGLAAGFSLAKWLAANSVHKVIAHRL